MRKIKTHVKGDIINYQAELWTARLVQAKPGLTKKYKPQPEN